MAAPTPQRRTKAIIAGGGIGGASTKAGGGGLGGGGADDDDLASLLEQAIRPEVGARPGDLERASSGGGGRGGGSGGDNDHGAPYRDAHDPFGRDGFGRQQPPPRGHVSHICESTIPPSQVWRWLGLRPTMLTFGTLFIRRRVFRSPRPAPVRYRPLGAYCRRSLAHLAGGLCCGLGYLLVFVPVAVGLRWFHAGEAWVFATALLGLIPLAAQLGDVTEELASYTSDAVGGLLNATFGNATEVIIALVALRHAAPGNNLLRIVQLSLLGSVVSNLLLVLGCAFLVGGLRYAQQRFGAEGRQWRKRGGCRRRRGRHVAGRWNSCSQR